MLEYVATRINSNSNVYFICTRSTSLAFVPLCHPPPPSYNAMTSRTAGIMPASGIAAQLVLLTTLPLPLSRLCHSVARALPRLLHTVSLASVPPTLLLQTWSRLSSARGTSRRATTLMNTWRRSVSLLRVRACVRARRVRALGRMRAASAAREHVRKWGWGKINSLKARTGVETVYDPVGVGKKYEQPKEEQRWRI